MLRELISEAPFYIAVLALGINGVYLARDYFLRRQRRKDAERAKAESEVATNEISR